MVPTAEPTDAPGLYPRLAREAYVLGRWGPVFEMRVEAATDEVRAGHALARRRPLARDAAGFIDDALRQLAIGGQADAAVLVEVYRAVDRLRASGRRLARTSRDAAAARDVRSRHAAVLLARVGRGVIDLERLTPFLFVAGTALRPWHALGAAAGDCLRAANRSSANFGIELFVEDLLLPVARLRAASLGMAAEWASPALRLVAGLEDPVVHPDRDGLGSAQAAYSYFLELAFRERTLLNALAGRPAPSPVIVLDHCRLVFDGRDQLLRDLPPPQVAVLWVLAERVGNVVGLQDLLFEAGIQSDVTHAKEHVSRCRKMLKELLPAESSSPTRKARVKRLIEFVKSDRRGAGEGGYRLSLHRTEVVINGPRPPWMPRR